MAGRPQLRSIPAQPKAIHDEMGATFDEYGRMKASLGVQMPNPTPNLANFIMQSYADPATEIVKLSNSATMISGFPLLDGTQIWRVNHNGVDTHPIHFHLFHVQLINRVGWDGAYRCPTRPNWAGRTRSGSARWRTRTSRSGRSRRCPTASLEGAQQFRPWNRRCRSAP